MPLGYKYAERSADSDVNWFKIGKELTDTLSEANRIREEKKEAYNQATREDMNNLANAPQGENQDVNGFTNNYVDLMTNQMLMDEKLFKSGRMSEKQYRLRRQNYTDGTSQLFNLSKVYQAEAAKTMADIDNGTLQSGLTISNMSSVEGIGNFSSSVATIDSLGDGRVGINLYENKIIDGKKVKVLSTNAVPVNVAMSKMMHKPLKFKVDEVTTSYVDGLGTRKDFLIEAATTAKAGSITELMGPDFLATKKDPVTQKIVKDTKDSISLQIDSYFQNPYNLTSILGDELGKYNPSSFIYDKAEAAKDPTKILLKIDPITNLPTIDEEGPNYKKQYEEASDFVAKKIYSKIDLERGIKPTAQSQLQESAETIAKVKKKYEPKPKEDEESDTATNMIGKLYYGDDNEVQSSIEYFKGLKNTKGEILFKDVIRNGKEGVTVYLPDGSSEKISFLDKNNKPRTQEDFIASAGPLLAGQLDVSKSLKRGAYKKGAKFNETSEGRGTTIEKFKVDASVVSQPSQSAVVNVQAALPEGFIAEDTGNYIPFSKTQNQVTVTSVSSGKKYVVTTNVKDIKDDSAATNQAIGLEDFVNGELNENRDKPKSSGKEINRADIPAKAKAAGYTPQEYEKLLKENGVTIK